MHMVIRVVVEAHDMRSAVEAAQNYFNNHLHYEDGGPFDYCTPMVEGHTVSGADRWIDYKNEDVAFPLTSDPGRAEVEDAWAATLDYMEDNLEDVWEAIEEAGDMQSFMEVLLNEEDLVRHKMNKFAGYQSTDYFLYVQGWNSSGVRSRRGWEYVQELMAEDEQRDEHQRWVVPLDVHY